MKKSDLVATSILSGSLLLALHHGAVYRDQYRSRAECEADWRQYPGECREESGSSTSSYGGSRFYGPSYVEGRRPRTQQQWNVVGHELVKRSGFGRSGARFSGGG